MASNPVRDYLAELGRRGAKVTNSKLTAKQRKDSARRAAQARWSKQKGKNPAKHP